MNWQQIEAQVFRLQRLLEHLRERIAEGISPSDPSGRSGKSVAEIRLPKVQAYLGLKHGHLFTFWVERSTAGDSVLKAVRRVMGEKERELCDQIAALSREMSDNYKSLVRYPTDAIALAFELYKTFNRAKSQKSVTQRDQMSGSEFGSFFGPDKDFVVGVVCRVSRALDKYDDVVGRRVFDTLGRIDWDTVRPEPTAPAPIIGQKLEVKRLIDEVRPNYPSNYALAIAMGIHRSTYNNLLNGTAKSFVVVESLDKLRKLKAQLKPAPTSKSVPSPRLENYPTTGSYPKPEKQLVKEKFPFVGGFISGLQALVKMVEASGLDPNSFTDGHRGNILDAVGKIMDLAKIDQAAIKRMQSTEGLSLDDPGLQKVMSALTKRGN